MILAIDSTSREVRLNFVGRAVSRVAERQAAVLPGLVEEMLAAGDFCQKSPRRVPSAIAVVVGPGSFTGIRLGIAFAKGLALGFGVPVYGVSLFDCATILGGLRAQRGGGIVAIRSERGDFYVKDGEKYFIAATPPAGAIVATDFDLSRAAELVNDRPVIPLYIRPSYAD